MFKFSLCPASFVHNHTRMWCGTYNFTDSKFSVFEKRNIKEILGPCIAILLCMLLPHGLHKPMHCRLFYSYTFEYRVEACVSVWVLDICFLGALCYCVIVLWLCAACCMCFVCIYGRNIGSNKNKYNRIVNRVCCLWKKYCLFYA